MGLYIPERTEKELVRVTQLPEYEGNWVCVDANDIKDIEYLVEVCSHEVAHHIYRKNVIDYDGDKDEFFAEFCEDNITKCIGINWDE